MSFPFFISNRFAKSKKGSKFISLISVISIIGIALGVAVLIIALTVLNGFEESVKQKIIKFNSHIKITAFGNKNLEDYQTGINRINNILANEIESVSPFIQKYAIIKSKRFSEGITITGLNPEMNNSNIEAYITAGEFEINRKTKNQSIVIGKKLAEKLFVQVGDKITLFTLKNDELPSPENPPGIENFIVTGIYESGMADYDDLNVYINFSVAQNLFDLNDAVSGYNIKLNDITKIDQAALKLSDNLRYPHYVRTVYNVHQNIFTWLDLQKEPIPIVLGLIIIVAVFNIVGTLLMLVLERTRAIGILKSMGASRKQITRIFLYQGIYLSLIGIALGNTTAYLISIVQREFNIISLPSSIYFISEVPVLINSLHYLLISVVTFFLCIAASYIPSLIAAKINPINAIRFD
ncbi:MAG: ABC transporter permease [Melioribacteraceae bacterium]|nr:ABC transporter permease [Melioribacteraceae bacterium]MCF8355649.1 ABC transporter permease [Melioribacteraceae bacterium]MCF8394651.1 ABC transporter permease [Melioribacteraceae bacterium]MCF8418015.1 ABC transporter permease [Melioribacteraceae bacterium]